MTTKNVRKTPKINILLTLIAVVTLVSISGTYVNAEVTNPSDVTVSTQSSDEMIDLSEETTDLYEQYKPEPITELQKTSYNSIALDDSRIKKLIHGKSVEITGYSHEGNIITKPGVWDVLVHMNVDDRVVVAKINTETNKVDFVSDEPQQKLANGHAVDYYSGSQTLNGLYEPSTILEPENS